MAVCLVVVLFVFRDYGVTNDEHIQAQYGLRVWLWLSSGFEDRSLFELGNLRFYGAFYELAALAFQKSMPLKTLDARHLFNALFSLLGLVGVYRLGTLLGGSPTGLLAAAMLLLVPRWVGHSFNKPEGHPLCCGLRVDPGAGRSQH